MEASKAKKGERKQQILESLASMLESNAGQRITTAKLAAHVGVSEAALYRHFPSKKSMFEGLIDFVEQALLSRINLILEEQKDTLVRCQQILQLLLVFTERNPGITRILSGDALLGEDAALRGRVAALFNKIETQIKQVLREKQLREGQAFALDEAMLANLLLAIAEGRISQFVRSDFKTKPTHNFAEQWQFVAKQLLQS